MFPSTKAFSVPWFLYVGKCCSLLDLHWVLKSRFKELLVVQVRECRGKGKTIRKQFSVKAVLVPPQEVYKTIWLKSLSFSIGTKGLPAGTSGKESACNSGDTRDMGSIPGSGRILEEGIATHSSILAWWILWTEDSGRL